MLGVVGFASAPAHASCAAIGVVICGATATATSLPFGDYNPSSSAPRDISSTITVTATSFGVGLLTTIGYSIGLNEGANGSFAARKMVGGSAATPLSYNLFTNTNYDQVWGIDSVNDRHQRPGHGTRLLGVAQLHRVWSDPAAPVRFGRCLCRHDHRHGDLLARHGRGCSRALRNAWSPAGCRRAPARPT